MLEYLYFGRILYDVYVNRTLSNWSLLSARISSQESIVELGPLNVTMKKEPWEIIVLCFSILL
jgi:hypothetical protein